MANDETWMELALAEADAASAQGEVPVGCVLVDRDGESVLGRGHNLRETSKDPTAHAEMLAIGFTRKPKMVAKFQKLAEDYMAHAIRDPELRKKLTPDFPLGCKRVLISDDFYPSLQRENVDVITDRVAEIHPNEIGSFRPAGMDGNRHLVQRPELLNLLQARLLKINC